MGGGGGGIQEYGWKQVSTQLLSAALDGPARLQTDLSSDHRPCHNSQFWPSRLHSEKLSAAPFLGHPSCPRAAANLEPVLMGELGG